MRSARKILLALVSVLAASPVAAQSGGTVELGAFGRYTKFGKTLATDITNNLPADNGFGGGLRFGIFLVRNLAIEADASYTKVNAADSGKVRHIPIHAGLTYNIPLGGKSAFLLGARFVRNNYGGDADFSDNGFGGVAGFRFGPLRLEGTLDKMTNDDPAHGTYHNFGVNAGLSLLLGGCNKSADGVTLSPTSVTLDRGERTNFTATATKCGKAAQVTFSATGGTITESGEYIAGSSPGSYQVTATEPKSGLTSTAAVTIKEPPPPPPPPPPPMVTLTRIELTPERASVKMSESVSFQVRGINSDGTTRALSNCTYTATGNPTQSGSQFSWARPGNYTVTVQCEGMNDTSAVEVRLEVVLFGSNFAFNSSRLTASGLDTLRAAADSLKKYPEIMLRLGGHADFVGTDAYNCNLSWRRARTVQEALRRFGIGDDRISMVEGFGEAYPVPDDLVPEEWKEINRQTRDKGKWWDRRVVITSGEKPAGMTVCSEPPGR